MPLHKQLLCVDGTFGMDTLTPEAGTLSFTIKTFDDPQTGKLPSKTGSVATGRKKETLNVLILKLKVGQLSHKQPLM